MYMVCMAYVSARVCVSVCVCCVCVVHVKWMMCRHLCLHTCVWCVFAWCTGHVYMCLAQHTEVPITHKQNQKRTPLGEPALLRAELGPQDTS